MLLKRCFARSRRFPLANLLRSLLALLIIYSINILFGVKDSLWSEKSFENEYHLTMTRIDPQLVNEANAGRILGPPKYHVSTRYLIANEGVCQSGDVRLLILVKSAITNAEARQAIRLTWANKASLSKNSIRLAFVLGRHENNITVDRESKQHGDIIQIDHIDNYYSNSRKSMPLSRLRCYTDGSPFVDKMLMMLRWVNEFCSSSLDLRRYSLFVDDDYYLDLNSLLQYINRTDENKSLTREDRRTFLTGHVYQSSHPRRFLHDRWYISMQDYPYDRYPPYVTAGCFLLTRSCAKLLYLSSKYTALFRFDDIYIGLLAYSMSIKPIENNQLFSSYVSSRIVSRHQTGLVARWRKLFSNSIDSTALARPICVHGYRGQELIHIWNDIYQSNLTLQAISG